MQRILKKNIPNLNILDNISFGNKTDNLHISELGLFNCNIDFIPDFICNLTRLKTLYLGNNNLHDLPDSLKNIKNLSKLDLSNNNFTEVPNSIGNLKNLIFLNLSNNFFNVFPISLLKLTSIVTLKLDNNSIKTIPKEICKLNSMESLNLMNNPIKEIPEILCTCTSLKFLKINWTELAETPDCILKFKYSIRHEQGQFLEEIINIIGKEIKLGDKITWNACKYQIKDEEIIELSIYNCGLKSIPKSFGSLNSLRKLYLNKNKLSQLPKSISNFAKLEVLSLKDNNFKKIPSLIWTLENLKELKLDNNPLDDESTKVIDRDIPFIQNFCRDNALIDIFMSHAVENFEYFRLIEISDFLENQDEIDEVFYCERDLVGDIDKYMDTHVPKCHIVLFFATKKTIYNSPDCNYEIKLAKESNKIIIPIKGKDVDWSDLTQYKLDRIKGFNYDSLNFEDFLSKLYKDILKIKRKDNLFEK